MKNLIKFIVVTVLTISSIAPISVGEYIAKYGQPIMEDGQLTLSNKDLTSLEGLDEIQNADTVSQLYLESNKIQKLPAGIFDRFTNVEHLVLFDNPIHTVAPRVFDRLHNLDFLDLEYNKLPETKQEFKELYLKNNLKLEDFSYKFQEEEQAAHEQRQLLQADHTELLNLIRQFKQSDVARREQLFPSIRQKIQEIMEHPARRLVTAARDEDGNTALHLAVLAADKDLVELLAPIPGWVAWQNKDGNTPLHEALLLKIDQNKMLEIVQALLPYSSDILNLENKPDGDTPMTLAAGKPKIISRLILYGKRLQRRTGSTSLKLRRTGTP